MRLEERSRQVLVTTLCRMAELSGGRVELDDGVALFDGAAPGAGPWAGLVRTDPTMPAEEVLGRAGAFFAGSDRPFTVMTLSRGDKDLESHLRAAGHQAVVDGPEMWLEHPIAPVPESPDLVLAEVDDADGRDDFLEVVGRAFADLGEDPDTWPVAYPDVASLSGRDRVAMVGRTDAGPVTCGMIYLDGRTGHVIHVGTDPKAQGQGLGTAMTAALTNGAFDRGADLVTLLATPRGEPVYVRLGYGEHGRARWWLLEPG